MKYTNNTESNSFNSYILLPSKFVNLEFLKFYLLVSRLKWYLKWRYNSATNRIWKYFIKYIWYVCKMLSISHIKSWQLLLSHHSVVIRDYEQYMVLISIHIVQLLIMQEAAKNGKINSLRITLKSVIKLNFYNFYQYKKWFKFIIWF